MTVDAQTYHRFIQRARIGAAVAFSISAIGFVCCAYLRFGIGAAAFGCVCIVCLAVVAALVAEQIFAAWITLRRGRFSLASLFLITTFFAILFAVMRHSVALALTLLVSSIVLASIGLVEKRKPSSPDVRS